MLRIIAATYNKRGLIMRKHTIMRMCGVLLASSLAAGCGEVESGLEPRLDPATMETESPPSPPKAVYRIIGAATPAAPAAPTMNGIPYNGGPVMTGTVNAYYIFYGNWAASDRTI